MIAAVTFVMYDESSSLKGNSCMKKTYVIDTNVFIQAPYAVQCFDDNNLVIPLVVIEELDGLKKADGEKGANARAAVRMLRISGKEAIFLMESHLRVAAH